MWRRRDETGKPRACKEDSDSRAGQRNASWKDIFFRNEAEGGKYCLKNDTSLAANETAALKLENETMAAESIELHNRLHAANEAVKVWCGQCKKKGQDDDEKEDT